MQDPVQTQEAPAGQELAEPLELLFKWCLVTIAGYLLGSWLGGWLGHLIAGGTWLGVPVAQGLARGVLVGLGQWWLLWDHVRTASLWIVVSAIGWCLLTVGLVVGAPIRQIHALVELVVVVGLGALLGFVQWLYLRTQFARAGYWILGCAAAVFGQYAFARIIFLLVRAQWLFDLIMALAMAGVTGYTILLYLERKPADPDAPERTFRSLRPKAEGRSEPERVRFRPGVPPPETATPSVVATGPQPSAGSSAPPPSAPPASPNRERRRPPAPFRVNVVKTKGYPAKLILFQKPLKLQETHEPDTIAAVFQFELPRRPRRARLSLVYAGMSRATQAHFRQHVQLNGAVLMELHPRGRKLTDAAEYAVTVAHDSFRRTNQLMFVSRSVGTPQSENPFRLNEAVLDFEW